jgi:toxin ParE1/3/4
LFSQAAQDDLRHILEYTVQRWGLTQAAQYYADLQLCFQVLAANPGMGKACAEISPGLRRHESGKHVVFYRLRPDGIRVTRVLHQQMVPEQGRF